MNILEKIPDIKEKHLYKRYLAKGFPFDVVEFGRALGLEVKETEELPNRISGFIKETDGRISICTNKKHSPARKRFAVALGIGHYFLHRDRLSTGIIDGMLVEKEVEGFGLSLLIHEDLFKQFWKQEDCSIDFLTSYFYVSESEVITKIKNLNLLEDFSDYFTPSEFYPRSKRKPKTDLVVSNVSCTESLGMDFYYKLLLKSISLVEHLYIGRHVKDTGYINLEKPLYEEVYSCLDIKELPIYFKKHSSLLIQWVKTEDGLLNLENLPLQYPSNFILGKKIDDKYYTIGY